MDNDRVFLFVLNWVFVCVCFVPSACGFVCVHPCIFSHIPECLFSISIFVCACVCLPECVSVLQSLSMCVCVCVLDGGIGNVI